MKQLIIIIVSLVTLSSCCSFIRNPEYKNPEIPTFRNSIVIQESKDQVWDQLITSLKDIYSPFIINAMDKDKGHIEISYSGEPCAYVDCGQLSAEYRNTGRIFDPPFSTPLLFRNTYPACREILQYTTCTNTTNPLKPNKTLFKRQMWLEISSYIEVIEIDGGVEVTIAPSYEVIKRVKQYDEDTGYFKGQTYDPIYFSSYNAVQFPDSETICRANGMFEDHIITLIE